MRLTALILLLTPIAARAADEDGIRLGQVQVAYFVEPVETKINPSEDLIAQMAVFLAHSGNAPIAITVNGRTTISKPTVPAARAEFETWVAPLSRSYVESVLTGFSDTKWQDGKTIIERFVRDNRRHVYARYAVTVETLSDGTYRATFAEPTSPAPDGVSASEGWSVVSPLNFPVPQVLEDGDTITLDLYLDSKTGQKVIEDIHVGKQVPMVQRKGAARDVYADDELKIAQPRIRKNGLVQELNGGTSTLDGSALWLYVPGEGRYVLSLKPTAGSKRAGEVTGNSLRFMSNGNVFRVDSAERISDAGSGTYGVYVSQESAWEPAEAKDRARLMIGSMATVPERH